MPSSSGSVKAFPPTATRFAPFSVTLHWYSYPVSTGVGVGVGSGDAIGCCCFLHCRRSFVLLWALTLPVTARLIDTTCSGVLLLLRGGGSACFHCLQLELR